jgi:hypothetical protein
MPFEIHVKCPNSTTAMDAGVLTAFNTFLTAAQSAVSPRKVDAGGSVIAGKPVAGDETNNKREFGTPW